MAADAQPYVVVRVTDEGSGMDDATRQQLFTPFFTTKSSGTGLGLMSCKRIVESVKGRIEVSSTLGKGTSFELHLPAPKAEAPKPEAPKDPAPATPPPAEPAPK